MSRQFLKAIYIINNALMTVSSKLRSEVIFLVRFVSNNEPIRVLFAANVIPITNFEGTRFECLKITSFDGNVIIDVENDIFTVS